MRLTKKGALDKRYRENKKHERLIKWNRVAALAIIWFFLVVGFLILIQSFRTAMNAPLVSPKGRKPTVELKVGKVMAQDWNDDLVGYFRHKGQLEGYNDYVITKLHGIMDCENGLHTANRVNYLYDGENGRYTAAGFAMITKSTFKGNNCEGDRFNGVDNINCFYKIYAKSGVQPWNTSRSCWIKKFSLNGLKLK